MCLEDPIIENVLATKAERIADSLLYSRTGRLRECFALKRLMEKQSLYY